MPTITVRYSPAGRETDEEAHASALTLLEAEKAKIDAISFDREPIWETTEDGVLVATLGYQTEPEPEPEAVQRTRTPRQSWGSTPRGGRTGL